MANKFVSQSLQLGRFRDSNFYRADMEFYGVDHSEVSFECRIFFNHPNADETTPTKIENGYAGSFHIFGHGGCFGDVGHCDQKPGIRPFDKRSQHSITPVEVFVPVTDALKAAIKQGDEVTVTLVPIVKAATEMCDVENVLKFTKFNISVFGLPGTNQQPLT